MKKRSLTLIEIMIVIMLISLIGGAIGYNMKGSLNKGKRFKTERAKEQLHDLLMICVDEGEDPQKVADNPEFYLKKSGVAKDAAGLIKDGWGKKFIITYNSAKAEFEIKQDEGR